MRTGQAALPLVLVICGIIIEIAIAGVFVAFILSNSGWGERLSAQALAAAKAGQEDAFIKITLNKNFTSTNYSFSVDSQSVNVTITKDPVGYPAGTAQIISVGKALTRQRKLEGIVLISQNNGKVDLKSLKEIQ